MIYYVDNINGKAEYDGKSAQTPCQDYKKLNLNPGDSLLFKRGSIYNESLVLTAGEDGSPITYGAWGEGEKPAFFGGTDVSNPEDWELSATENVWICVKNTYGNLANIILNVF